MTETTTSPQVMRYLDLSTAHVTEAEWNQGIAEGLPDIDETGPRIIRHEYGAWVNVPDPSWTETYEQLREHYPNVAACIERARDHGCSWINFDSDAGHEPDLPTFDW